MTNQTKTRSGFRTSVYWALAPSVIAVAIAVVVFWHQSTNQSRLQTATPPPIDTVTTPPDIVTFTQETMVRSGIRVESVEYRAFTSEISTIGVIEIPEPSQKVIAARARGRIEHMFIAATGVSVHKGDPLFEFYSPDILSAERDYLISAGAGEMDQGHTTGMEHHADAGLLRANKKRLELYGLTEEQIRKIGQDATVANTVTVISPMNGLILQKSAQEGAYVDEGTTIFQLADLTSVWAEINVPEQNIRFVRVGQSIPIHTDAYPEERFVGRVISISPVEDLSSRTIRVRLSLQNPALKLRPQMTFTAVIRAELGRSLAIPQSAVVRTGDGDYVWLTDSGNMFTRHAVRLGVFSPDNYYQVISGLSGGDKVAANGSFLVDAEHELAKSNPMAGMNMGEAGSKNSGEGTGVVRRINVQDQTITLDHGNIPGIMAAMTMAYKVADAKMLQSVHASEPVSFTLAHSDSGEWLITEIHAR